MGNSSWLNWRRWLRTDGPVALKEPSFSGLLDQLRTDAALCRLLIGGPGEGRRVRRGLGLTEREMRLASSIALLAQMEEILEGNYTWYCSDDFLGLFRISNLEQTSQSEIILRALNTIGGLVTEIVRRKLTIVEAPKDFRFSSCVYEEDGKRYVLWHRDATESDQEKGILAGTFGLSYEKIDYITQNNQKWHDPQLALDRPDIWRALVKAWVCHAVDKLPDLNAHGWDLQK